MKNIFKNWKSFLSGTATGVVIGFPVGVMVSQGRIGELVLAGWNFIASIFKLAAALL